MVYRLRLREGWTINHKRVTSLWRRQDLQQPTPRKRTRANAVNGSVRRHRVDYPLRFWATDFQFYAQVDAC